MTPEEERVAELGVAGKHYAKCPCSYHLDLLKAAALAYARPIVAEELVSVVDGFRDEQGASKLVDRIVGAIREHGRKP